MPTDTLPRQTDADAPDLLEFARAHVARVRERCPWVRAIDPEVHVACVVAWLQPLPADRHWLRRRWTAPRGDATWCGGAVGLVLPRQRQGAT